LADNLKQQGFAASVKEVASDKGTVFKVRVGPMQDKIKAQAVKNKLTQLNINSFFAADD
jgi:DedD protein